MNINPNNLNIILIRYSDNDFHSYFQTIGKMIQTVINDWKHARTDIDITKLIYDITRTVLNTIWSQNDEKETDRIFKHLMEEPTDEEVEMFGSWKRLMFNEEADNHIIEINQDGNWEYVVIDFRLPVKQQVKHY